MIDRLIESGSTRQKGFEAYSLCRSICVGPEQTQFIRQDRNSFGSPQLGHRDTPTGRVNFKISLSLFRLEDNVESFVYSFLTKRKPLKRNDEREREREKKEGREMVK